MELFGSFSPFVEPPHFLSVVLMVMGSEHKKNFLFFEPCVFSACFLRVIEGEEKVDL
jgi:hypothetical protein